MKRQEYKYTTLWKEEDDNIVFARYAEKLEIDKKIAEELVQNRLDFSENVAKYYLIDLANIKSVTKEAREYMSDPQSGLKGVLAGAFMSSNAVTTMVLNFFLMINKPAVPAKFFTNKEDALSWLSKIRKEKEQLV